MNAALDFRIVPPERGLSSNRVRISRTWESLLGFGPTRKATFAEFAEKLAEVVGDDEVVVHCDLHSLGRKLGAVDGVQGRAGGWIYRSPEARSAICQGWSAYAQRAISRGRVRRVADVNGSVCDVWVLRASEGIR